MSVSSTGQVKKYVYDPSKPFAVDQQGNYMLSVSEKDCRRWLDGYRPFNYFAQNNSSSSHSNSSEKSTERVSTSEPENQNTEASSL
ncbi:hypothetical protein [Acinetobacter sp. YH01022]|uniref:hypothetical protein n=1 Tax=Acinetobacter sp. YH01022 TaxID=2601036 RepID=UPI0015D2A845|nr:hypothetical protein [Acinetobacter sp. YH01022]